MYAAIKMDYESIEQLRLFVTLGEALEWTLKQAEAERVASNTHRAQEHARLVQLYTDLIEEHGPDARPEGTLFMTATLGDGFGSLASPLSTYAESLARLGSKPYQQKKVRITTDDEDGRWWVDDWMVVDHIDTANED